MAHEHSHGEPDNTYFLDQLCTIAVCGLLGFTAIGLYSKGWLQSKFGLIEGFHIPVLAAGIALIVMVALRAVTVWRMAGQARAVQAEPDVGHEHSHAHDAACGHKHDAGEACGHEHAHGHEHSHAAKHEHSHGHEHSHAEKNEHSHAAKHEHSHDEEAHDHGWAPWRYAILIIPAVLYFLELPADGYNMTRLEADLEDVELDSAGGPVVKKNKKVNIRFSQLAVIASREKSRAAYEGLTVTLEGHFKMIPNKDKECQLFRVMNNCCSSDSITLQSRIVAPSALTFAYMDWVRIEGEISFQKIAGKNEWMPVIHLQSIDNIQKVPMPSNPNKDV